MERKVFYLPSKLIPKGSFAIHEAPLGLKEHDMIKLKEQDAIFIDDGSLAGDYIGVGIIRNMIKHEKTVAIVCNPTDLHELT